MNIVEMVTKQLAERAPEMLAAALANMPEDIKATIGQISQITLGFKAQLDRIESQQRLIMAHLNIPPETQERENEQRSIRAD